MSTVKIIRFVFFFPRNLIAKGNTSFWEINYDAWKNPWVIIIIILGNLHCQASSVGTNV